VQWFHKDNALPGANSFTLTLSSVQIAQAGGYRALVSSSGGALWSDTAMLTVLQAPQLEGGSTWLDREAGLFHLRLNGLAQYASVVIECSTNLSHWSPVLTNSSSVNPFEFSLPFATNNGALFYRAVARP